MPPKIAALFTRWSMRPNSAIVAAAISAVDAGSEMSTRSPSARPPPATMSSATFVARSTSMSATTTAAPSAANDRAYSSPIPPADPVTMLTAPSNRPPSDLSPT